MTNTIKIKKERYKKTSSKITKSPTKPIDIKTLTKKKVSRIKSKIESMSIEDKLNNLYHLQSVFSEIDNITIALNQLPIEVQDLKNEITYTSTQIDDDQILLLNYNKQISQEKIKIASSNTLIGKYKEQIAKVRNNKEYDGLSKEIENQELDIQLAEKHIKEFIEKIHILENKMQNNKQELKEKKINLKDKETGLEKVVLEMNFKKEQLKKQIDQIESFIEVRLLANFKKLRTNMKNGMAVVCIQRNACGGCFNKIPPQRQMEVKMRKKIIICEYCGRIIVDDFHIGKLCEE